MVIWASRNIPEEQTDIHLIASIVVMLVSLIPVSLVLFNLPEEISSKRAAREKLVPWDPNYCNETKLQDAAGLIKTALGQFLGYDCDPMFYHCRWGINGWRTYQKTCRRGLVYDTTGTQNCNYDFNVKGCDASKQCSDCLHDQFACCLSEECVDLGQRCDGKYDCLLEEDEQNCPTCGQHEFPCVRSEQCIPIEKRCNGVDDCRDGTDENNCKECDMGMFYCINTKRCVEQELRCDGKVDCSLGEDEAFCREVKRKDYVCRDQVNKIPMEKLCDGTDDCPDGSDEHHCTIDYSGSTKTQGKDGNKTTDTKRNNKGSENEDYFYY